MLSNKLSDFKIVLGSNSPRRKELLKELVNAFEVRTQPVEEVFPVEFNNGKAIAEYLAELKSDALVKSLSGKEILITADTIVWQNNKVLAKPIDRDNAVQMIQSLNAKRHDVITGVCIVSTKRRLTFSTVTKVEFGELSQNEIEYYVDTFKPYDKAGAYGIQEWIGFIGIKSIIGSYNNVVGLPTYELYQNLIDFIDNN